MNRFTFSVATSLFVSGFAAADFRGDLVKSFWKGRIDPIVAPLTVSQEEFGVNFANLEQSFESFVNIDNARAENYASTFESLTQIYRDLPKLSFEDRVAPFASLSVVQLLNFLGLRSGASGLPEALLRERIKRSLGRPEAFSSINSFNEADLWIQPRGIKAQGTFALGQSLQVSTLGIGIGCSYTFEHTLCFGLSTGFDHTWMKWNPAMRAQQNSVFVLASAGWLIPRGFIGMSVGGSGGDVNVKRTIAASGGGSVYIQRTQRVYAGMVSLSGGWDIPLGSAFWFRPALSCDFVGAREEGYSEEGSGIVSIEVGPSTTLLAAPRASVEVRREFFSPSLGVVVPSLTVGWELIGPMHSGGYRESGGEFIDKNYQVKNAGLVSLGLLVMSRPGIGFGAGYEASIGRGLQAQSARLSVEIDW